MSNFDGSVLFLCIIANYNSLFAVTVCTSDGVGAMHQLTNTQAFSFGFALILETRPFYVILSVLKLTMYIRLASDSKRYSCLCLASPGTKGVQHHAWLIKHFF